MPLKKLLFKAGVNRENTRYTTEGGWYECDKVRFRYGTPEKIGGWERISTSTYLGQCRSMWPWNTLNYINYLGMGTNLKYYVMLGGAYYDITPIRLTTAAGAITFAATSGSTSLTVNHTAHGSTVGSFVTYSGAVSLGGTVTATVLNAEYQITSVIGANSYTITLAVAANASDTGTGGASVVGAYQVNAGNANQVPLSGWGAGAWGFGSWGISSTGTESLRIWNAQNFGEDLIYGPRGGAMYYWDASAGLTTRGVALTSLAGASDVPTVHNLLTVSDSSRFTIAFGCNDYGSAAQDLMLIRWSDQESAVNWTPSATNQAGSIRLSHGSEIRAYAQMRQEILVWTDISLYSMQYLGPPVVWGSQLLADNVSILNDRAMGVASGVVYWIGEEKFYIYDGRVQTLPCDLREHVFGDFNYQQVQQVFAAVNDRFNEIWWFYCSSSATLNDRYVVYNYVEKIWYYGNISRTAWTDSSIVSDLPIAASDSRLLYHETGCDDKSTGAAVAIPAYITSSEFDIDDGHNLGFVWRVLPDITFRGSTTSTPQATMTLLPLQNSGSGYNNPLSVGGIDSQAVIRGVTIPVETFTGQVNIRVRGRQMSMKISSDGLGVQWQLGAPRIDIRPDGRGNNSNVGALSSWVGSFSGSIALQSFIVDTPYSLDLSTYFVGGLGPFSYGLSSGTLPDGLTLNSETGLVSGEATTFDTSSVVVYRRNESFGQYVDSNSITYTVLQPPDPYWANVSLLLPANGANGQTTTVNAASGGQILTAVGSAVLSTAQKKWGASSIYMPGNGSRFECAGWIGSQLGAGDFTIEFWFYLPTAASNGDQWFLSVGSFGAAGTWRVAKNNTQGISLSGVADGSGSGVPFDQWYHVAICRVGTAVTIYRNGVSWASGTSATNFNDAGTFRVGSHPSDNPGVRPSYIDDLRITKGIARYTANFTPPTAAFPNY